MSPCVQRVDPLKILSCHSNRTWQASVRTDIPSPCVSWHTAVVLNSGAQEDHSVLTITSCLWPSTMKGHRRGANAARQLHFQLFEGFTQCCCRCNEGRIALLFINHGETPKKHSVKSPLSIAISTDGTGKAFAAIRDLELAGDANAVALALDAAPSAIRSASGRQPPVAAKQQAGSIPCCHRLHAAKRAPIPLSRTPSCEE